MTQFLEVTISIKTRADVGREILIIAMESQNKIKMESFKELKLHLNEIGVLRVDSSAKERNSTIIKNCVVLGALVSCLVSVVWFRLSSAQTIREITESSCCSLSVLLFIVWYLALICQRENYAAFFDELDMKMQRSKQKKCYSKKYVKD